jgi:biotin transport system ATP-binding protein
VPNSVCSLSSSASHGVSSSIVLQCVHLARGNTQVFADLTLCLNEARIGLIGDNGAGKSSLFRLICGLDLPQRGEVRVEGERPQLAGKNARFVGMMFQNPDEQIIFPTVEEELALSLHADGLSRREAQTRVRAWLADRGLAAWAGRAIAGLSQGQRQHVCWLALLIAAPRVLLLDEPFASLDLPGQALLHREIAHASQQVLVSTHVLDHVRDFERVIWLDHGRVRADGAGRQVCAAYEADVGHRVATLSSARSGAMD